MKYRISPERYSFWEKCDKKHLDDGSISQESYNKLSEYMKKYKDEDTIPTSDFPDLEYELRTSDYIHSKCVASRSYCETLYSSLCNNVFIKDNKECSYTWRTVGGIVSNILEKGDYIDFYCSGNEGHITDEIRKDLTDMGWSIKDHDDKQI